MGMFDEIMLPQSQTCPKCDREINIVQTKFFENLMVLYRVNDVIDAPTKQCIEKEQVFCTKCVLQFKDIYIIVKYGILIGVEEDYERAEVILKDYDKMDLVNTAHILSKENTENMRTIRGAINGIDRIIKWFDRSKAKIAKDELLRNPAFSFFDDSVRGKDIFTALRDCKKELEENKPDLFM